MTVVRNTMVATFMALLWEELLTSSNAELAAIAGQALKEARYHQQHAADWMVRLGDGTVESHRRAQAAVDALWRYAPELFSGDAVDLQAEQTGLGPSWGSLQNTGRRRWSQCCMLQLWKRPRPRPSSAPASAACTASTWATSWPRCSICSAPTRAESGDGCRGLLEHIGRVQRAWAVLAQIPDPEVPVVTLCDLGMVRACRKAVMCWKLR